MPDLSRPVELIYNSVISFLRHTFSYDWVKINSVEIKFFENQMIVVRPNGWSKFPQKLQTTICIQPWKPQLVCVLN